MNMPNQQADQALPADSIDPRLLSLAMAFVPMQEFGTPYDPTLAFSRDYDIVYITKKAII